MHMAKHVTYRGGNIFADLGFEAGEAENLKMRSTLMAYIKRTIRERDLKQTEAAKVFGTTQPRISEIMNGRIDEFTIDSLVNMLSHAGVQMELHFIAEAV
jgi:predicted XRE-type DNA-binding protein